MSRPLFRGRFLALRGLRQRWALSLIVFVVAAAAVGAAALGPVYEEAARTALVRNVLTAAEADERGWYLSLDQGVSAYPTEPVDMEPPTIDEVVAEVTGPEPPDFLEPSVFGARLLSGPARVGPIASYPLVWRDGLCERVQAVQGRCPERAYEIMVSEKSGLRLGDRLRLRGLASRITEKRTELARLTVVGVYRVRDPGDRYWFQDVFPQTAGFTAGAADPLFTVAATQEVGHVTAASGGWIDTAALHIDPRRTGQEDVPALTALASRARIIPGVETVSRVPETIAAITGHLDSLGVPTLLVVGQITALGWLLLLLTVTDLVRARGGEIALARLRGQRRPRVWAFALAEPLTVLLAAVPAGLLLGLGAARLMADALLPPGIPVALSGTAVAFGLGAVAGGVLAAGAAAWRATRGTIAQQWRHTPRRAPRAWAIEAAVLALTAVGVVQLLATPPVTRVSGGQTGSLLVPALIAVGLALLGARLLPLACRALYGLTRRHGGIGTFLAVRQIARGRATPGSVIVLATAVGLAVFAVAAWAVTDRNFAAVARIHNGAETVFTVPHMTVQRLQQAVERADPSGTAAAPVVRRDEPIRLIATDPRRFAAVAHWRPDLGPPLSRLTAQLSTPQADRLMIKGDRMRVRVVARDVLKDRLELTLRVPGHTTRSSILLGLVRAGRKPTTHVFTFPLPEGCRAGCEVRSFEVHTSPTLAIENRLTPRSVTVERAWVRRDGAWRTADLRLDDPRQWRRVGGDVAGGDEGAVLRYNGLNSDTVVEVRSDTYPERFPALLNGAHDGLPMSGLDKAYAVSFRAVSTRPAVPGADGPAAVVDLELADRLAYGILTDRTEFQIWVAPGQAERIRRALQEQQIPIQATTTVAALVERHRSEGPGLALVLLLVTALAAAALALGRAVLGLHAAARRRAYELAALRAAGAGDRSLRTALFLELVVVLGFGALVGSAAGLLAAVLALPKIPEFGRPVTTPPLLYDVPPAPVLLAAAAALLASLVAGALTAEALRRTAGAARLREIPS